MRTAPLASVLPVMFVVGHGVACTTTTTITTSRPTELTVVVDGAVQDVQGGSVDVAVKPGFADVPWQLRRGDDVVSEGAIPRSEPVWGVVVAAVAATACCVPSLATAGFCLANPSLLAAPLLCAVAQDVGVCLNACIPVVQAPGWFTLPLMTAGSALGLSPLLLGLVGQAPPPAVTIPVPERSPPTTPENPPVEPSRSAQVY